MFLFFFTTFKNFSKKRLKLNEECAQRTMNDRSMNVVSCEGTSVLTEHSEGRTKFRLFLMKMIQR